MKPIIIAIVGSSGCGKTTMAEYIKEVFNIPTIVSFTTRPMRDGETQGREHQFVTDEQLPPQDEMLAYTKFGGYHYWAMHSQIPAKGICTYVIDEKGLLMLDEKFGDKYDLFPVLIQMDENQLQADASRTQRDKNRVVLSDEWYKLTITNDGTLDEFLQKVKLVIGNEINTNPLFHNFNIR